MGDFLLVWPALLSLARAMARRELLWAGRDAHAPWAAAAGWQPATGVLQRGVDALYSVGTWPRELEGARVTWFGLERNPLECRDSRLQFIHGVRPGRFVSPRVLARQALEALGVPWAEDWREVWRDAWLEFTEPATDTRSWDLLLFPGAGHRAKQWGVVQFLELAQACAGHGWSTAFVLGPAELERGLDRELEQAAAGRPGGLPAPLLAPASLQELGELLRRAGRVAGNDCGPMHLASMFGTPGVVLFGPTSRRQWAPEGLTPLASALPCRPCTVTTMGIPCAAPACMQAIQAPRVVEALLAVKS